MQNISQKLKENRLLYLELKVIKENQKLKTKNNMDIEKKGAIVRSSSTSMAAKRIT